MKVFRFVHLNVHSHYSINDGCASIRELVDTAIKDRMPGIAITDNGNMFGIMEFFDYVSRVNIERRTIPYFNLDMNISAGYRIISKRGVLFRQWANRILKDYLIISYVNERIHPNWRAPSIGGYAWAYHPEPAATFHR